MKLLFLTSDFLCFKIKNEVSPGENITFNLSVCDPISDPISVDSQVAIAYYTKQDINYAIYVGSMS